MFGFFAQGWGLSVCFEKMDGYTYMDEVTEMFCVTATL